MIPVLILAGGLGTRLRGVIGEQPKPLAEVAGHPFLWWLLLYLEAQGVSEAFLSVGYRHELVRDTFGERFGKIRLRYVVEEQPLGTGGAILNAIGQVPSEEFLICNGDTLALLDLRRFVDDARRLKCDVAIALADVPDASRYGSVVVGADGMVQRFVEKGVTGPASINAGVYFLRRDAMTDQSLPQRFSFEQDFLAGKQSALCVVGLRAVSAFIDIGIPEDYSLAQTRVPALVGRS